MVPKKETGRASRMVHLTGLDGLKPSRRLELLPYTAGRAEYVAPASTRESVQRRFARVRVSRARHEVRADQQSDRRRDGESRLRTGRSRSRRRQSQRVRDLLRGEARVLPRRRADLQQLRTRRLERQLGLQQLRAADLLLAAHRPRRRSSSADAEFADPPTATTILGAAKLTGKTARGWSIGLLEAVTSTEKAPTQTAFVPGEAVVEPMTNYAVVRLQRDIGRRAGVGMLATAVNRRITTPVVNATLPDNAYVAGADGYLFLDADRDWAMNFAVAGSRVDGSTAAITRLQRAPQRYYQRPDAPHLHARSERDQSQRVLRPRQSQPQQRTRPAERACSGASVRGSNRTTSDFTRNGDRAGAHAVVIWRNVTPGRVLRDRHDLGGEGVHVELRPRAAERRDRIASEGHVPELLVCGRGDLRGPPLARRSADARRSDGDESARFRSQRLGQHRRPEAAVAQRQWRHRATTPRAAGDAISASRSTSSRPSD